MPAHNLDPNDPKAVARILVALAIEHGGEFRVKAITYDGLEHNRALLVDYDKLTSELVIRVTSECGKVMIVPSENQSWLRSPESTPRVRAEIEAQQDVKRRIQRSDEELAELEERLNRRATLAREVEEGKVRAPFRTAPPSESP